MTIRNRSTTLHPAREGDRPLTSEDLWRIPRVGAPEPAPDGTWLAVPVTTYDLETNEGTSRIWRVPTDGGTPRPLTSPHASSKHPAISPDGNRLAFVRNEEGGKRAQLHVMPLDGGEPERLTDLPLGVSDPHWLADGSGLVCMARLLEDHLTPEATRAEIERREKDPVKAHVTEDRFYRFWDRWLTTGEVPHLFVVDLASGDVRDLIPASTLWSGLMEDRGHFDVAPDGGEVTFTGVWVEGDEELIREGVFVVPTAGGEMRCLTTDHAYRDFRPRYTSDGTGIVYGMTLDPGFYADRTRIMRYDRAAGVHGDVLTDWDLSPDGWEVAPDGRLFVLAGTNGRSCLYCLDDSDVPWRLTQDGSVSGPRPAADGHVYFTYQSLVAPPEIWRCDPDGKDPLRLTHFTDAALEGVALGEVVDVHFIGAEDEAVQMFVVLPPGHLDGDRAPLVQVIHGGPHGVSADSFHFRWNGQLFAAPGYVAAMVNFQGSTSWGQDFAKRIQGGWGDRPYRDILAATDTLVEMGLANPDRMAAAGGSYGGYMAAWIASKTNRFRCVVNHAGVYDLVSQYASDVTQGRADSFGGNAWDDIEAIERWSPAHHAEGLDTPMLVIHGEQDFRVPVTQGLQCYNVLKAKGVPARLVYFPDENHWVLKPRNGVLWYREVHDWLARFLG
jgi:dipeptidyl aminopeptidase/acylaminoacyl peptidase